MNKFLKTPEIIRKINLIVSDNADHLDGFDFDQLNDFDKTYLAAQCIKALGNDAAECLSGDDAVGIINALSSYMLSYSSLDRYDLTDALEKAAVNYFANHLSEMLSQAIDDYKNDLMFEAGLNKHTDRINGEISWR